MIDPKDRSCIACAQWIFDPGHANYSHVTPGEDWQANCLKWTGEGDNKRLRWLLDGYKVSDNDWFLTMQQAKTCPDYDERQQRS